MEPLCRIFENQTHYTLEHPKHGHLRLKEDLTGSVVRLQTSDEKLSSTFNNPCHNRDRAVRISGITQ